MRVVCLADDLSGANEVAAVLASLHQYDPALPDLDRGGPAATVYLGPPEEEPGDSAVTVVNTNSRLLGGTAAAAQMRDLLFSTLAPSGDVIFLKFDSLLRGDVAEQLVAAGGRGPVLFCPAVPELGRTVRDGVIEVHGRPLHETELWNAENRKPAHSVSAQLAAARTAHVSLDGLRSTHSDEIFAAAAKESAVVICDAETAEDLDRIAAAGLSSGAILAGAAGLAAALRRQLGDPQRVPAFPVPPPNHADVLVVLGTASLVVQQQVRVLEVAGIPVHRVHPEDLDKFVLPAEGTVALHVDGRIDPAISRGITPSLARLVNRQHGGRHLVLSGGETAQAILADLGITQFVPLVQVHPGAVVGVTSDGRLLATRPGSYGSKTSLLEILSTMHALQNPDGKVSS